MSETADTPDSAQDNTDITDPEVYGAAPERTALAWQRTGLSVVLGCFVVFVASFRTQNIVIGVAAGVLGLAISALSVFTVPVTAYARGHRVDSWPMLVVAAVAVSALGVLGTFSGLLTLLR